MIALSLIQLASQKSLQARERTCSAIDRYRDIITMTEKVSQETVCHIYLPNHFIEGLHTLEEKVITADYLLALSLEREAVSKGKEVLIFTAQSLRKRIVSEQRSLKELNEEVEKVQEEYRRHITNLDKIHQGSPPYGLGMGCGLGLGLVAFILIYPLADMSRSVESPFMSFVVAIVAYILTGTLLFGWLLIPILQYIRYRRQTKRLLSDIDNERRRHLKDKDDKTKQLQDSASETLNNIRKMETVVKDIETQVKY